MSVCKVLYLYTRGESRKTILPLLNKNLNLNGQANLSCMQVRLMSRIYRVFCVIYVYLYYSR